jgi:UDP-N-acetylmuramoylalanine--D-glutamate ligase
VAAVLRKFPGLEHRLEFVREKDDVTYINDSKGTNVGAVVKSVEGFTQPVILIAGGLDKGSDFSPLYDLFNEKVKLLILIGKAAGKMAQALGTATETVFAETLQDAVTLASERARSGDVVLLSPACASFDMFRDFEDRGRQFKQAVKSLQAERERIGMEHRV